MAVRGDGAAEVEQEALALADDDARGLLVAVRPLEERDEALVQAMQLALEAGDPVAAELTAADCVVEAESKDHHDWELVGMLAEKTKGEKGKAL